MILCECGEIVDGSTFKDYIKTSANPSTPTIGHEKCGHIFDFIDEGMPKKYSSRTVLKSIAMNFALKHNMSNTAIEILLLEVDRLKSSGDLCDGELLLTAFRNIAARDKVY